jgi:A/G-specific adenine glycosylase
LAKELLKIDTLVVAIKGKRARIQSSVVEWAATFGRHYPWREDRRTAYEILMAEVLLKRTTATSAARAYPTMVAQYPTPRDLSMATEEELASYLTAVGLQRQRAKSLRQLGQYLVEKEGGTVPSTLERLRKVPGLGEYSARAILSFGFGLAAAVVDSNIERVLTRLLKGMLPERIPPAIIQDVADMIILKQAHKLFNWGLLDIGALVCRYARPLCHKCPLANVCDYFNEAKQTGQVQIMPPSPLRRARQAKQLSLAELSRRTGVSKLTIIKIESGRTVPRPETLQRLAAALGVLAEELTARHDE